MCIRDSIQSAHRGGGEGGYALYIYSSFPEKYKQRWVERNGDPEEQMHKEMIRSKVQKDEDAEKFFESYRYDKNGENVPLPDSVQTEYVRNASVLNTLFRDLNRLTSSTNKLNGGRRNLWEILLSTCELLREEYGHTLPGRVGRLKALMAKYKPNNYEKLISGKYGNKNTLKIDEEAGRFLIALKRSRVPVYTDMQIFEEYNRVAPEKEWKLLKSPRSLREWLNSPRIEPLWYDAVYGLSLIHI